MSGYTRLGMNTRIENALDDLNCGERRTIGPLEWISCEDKLGASCRPRGGAA